MHAHMHAHTHTHTHSLSHMHAHASFVIGGELGNVKCLDETVTSAIKIWIICWMWACVCLRVPVYLGVRPQCGCEHTQTQTDTHEHTQWFPGDRGLSLLLFNAEGCRRYKTTQCRGLMDQRPADLESCSEYWSAPNTDGRSVCVCVCVCVCVWERERERETLGEGDVCGKVCHKECNRERRESSKGMHVRVIFYVCNCRCIYLRLLIWRSLLANQRCTI